MAPAPEMYTPEYCEAVRAGCTAKMDSIACDVKDVHGAVFGSDTQPGMMALLTRKLSISSVKWVFAMIGIPIIMGALSFYAFYIKAPLLYGEKAFATENRTRIERVEKDVQSLEDAVSQLPTGTQMKDIFRDALKEHAKK